MADEVMQAAGVMESMTWWNTTPGKSLLYCSGYNNTLFEELDLSFDASAPWINPQEMITHGAEDYGMFDLNRLIMQGGEWTCNSGSSSPPNQVLPSSSSFANINNESEDQLIIDQIRATLLGTSPTPSSPNPPQTKTNKKKKNNNKDETSSMKRQRIETPSSLPTFKVRKEKLGDRITALQQLVSPFGKTDTASVLHEAIEYIKFLHNQLNALNTPYMKSGAPIQHHHHHQQGKDEVGRNEELKSKGLCLVPISSTFPVAHETTSDFWTPTFGATFS